MEHLNCIEGCISFINALRSTDLYIKTIYLQGGCYQFYLLLKTIYPDAIPWINSNKDHVVTEVFGKLFDIEGIVDDESDFVPLTSKIEVSICEKWSFHRNARLRITSCPNCEEPICFEE